MCRCLRLRRVPARIRWPWRQWSWRTLKPLQVKKNSLDNQIGAKPHQAQHMAHTAQPNSARGGRGTEGLVSSRARRGVLARLARMTVHLCHRLTLAGNIQPNKGSQDPSQAQAWKVSTRRQMCSNIPGNDAGGGFMATTGGGFLGSM